MRNPLARLVAVALPLTMFPCPAVSRACVPTDDPLFGPQGPDPNGWSLVATSGPGVVTAALVYDSDARRALLIGGGGADYSNGVWKLPLQGDQGWSLLETAGRPPTPRRSMVAIYDPKLNRVLMRGGFDGAALGDLWQLDLSHIPTWSIVDAAGTPPPPLAASAAVYDSKRNRMIVIDGSDGGLPNRRIGGVWALDLSGHSRWRTLQPNGPAPAPRSAHSAIYDAKNDRVVIFGGTAPSYSDELWELRLDGNGAWRRLDPPGPRPSAREEHCAVYDPAHQEMLIYGGVGVGTDYGRSQILALRDAWALSLGDSPRWRSLGESPDRYGRWGHRAIYDPAGSRMIVSGGWGSIGSTMALATGPPPAASVAAVAAAAAPPPGGPTDLPLRLAIRVVNPSRGAIQVRLELPSTASVRLELFDVAGRRVGSRELTGLGAGRPRYRWDESAKLPAGIYLLRVSQAREVVKNKVILLR